MIRRLLADRVQNLTESAGISLHQFHREVGHGDEDETRKSEIVLKNLKYGLRPMPLYLVEEYIRALRIHRVADKDAFRLLSVLTRITDKDQEENDKLAEAMVRLLGKLDRVGELEKQAAQLEAEVSRLRAMIETVEKAVNPSE